MQRPIKTTGCKKIGGLASVADIASVENSIAR